MATELTNFANAPLPTFFSAEDVKQANEGLNSHASASFPVLSLNGKRFTVVRGDEQQVIMNPLDPNSTAQYIDVVLIKVPKTTAKAYYTGTYNPDDDSAKTPVCFSSTGIIPDSGCKAPQSDCCADCPYNKWGSAVSVDGKATKGKACRDAVRVAIAPLGDISDPMLLRVPPTSIKSLGDLGSLLTRRGVPFNAVIVRISFDPKETAQKLVFTPTGFVSEPQFKAIKEVGDSEIVKAITGETDEVISHIEAWKRGEFKVIPAAQSKPSSTPAVEQAVAQGRVTKEAFQETISKGKAEPEQKQEASVMESTQLEGLDDLKFDD